MLFFLFGTLILYITFVYMVVYKEVIYSVKVKYISRGKNMERPRFCGVVGLTQVLDVMGFFGSCRNLGTGVIIKQWRGLARTPRSCGLREMPKPPLSRLIYVRHSFGVSRRHIATRKRM